jgi:hypothetical protein
MICGAVGAWLREGERRKLHLGKDRLDIGAAGIAALNSKRQNGLQDGDNHLALGEVAVFGPDREPAFHVAGVTAID